MCMALNDPPYELAPLEFPELTLVSALQLEHGASLTLTVKLLAFVASHLLVLLAALLLLALQLHACPPTYMALIDPPCEFAA